jgi:hypothetical protein
VLKIKGLRISNPVNCESWARTLSTDDLTKPGAPWTPGKVRQELAHAAGRRGARLPEEIPHPQVAYFLNESRSRPFVLSSFRFQGLDLFAGSGAVKRS